ncbi:vacuolar protein sorting-associated protein 26A, putative [Entamoeba invadens IP1]|uniref:Vacuolar protein sorting-associated protein 26A, putative n=1 Tax=Entamoeba invadens IP1 TaxID=370355 RepID=A0A0A1TXF1_ENTIV|nr:vacuolar protein sorting-associated protein 26A, putative [Entamoeba invadens IP1]ELP85963.1 vacuolar protein sorting-associated protein 26A, putative [Entamoeba invadens IP1]|eukprot:XP_004185309.1 vacuolar protein sorting-associated protein 26A, putative [Entamoeba invadens IP1]
MIFQTPNGQNVFLSTFLEGEFLYGSLYISVSNKRCECQGVRMELIGVIESDSQNCKKEFLRKSIDICASRVFEIGDHVHSFTFGRIDRSDDTVKRYDTYFGVIGRIRYFIRTTLTRTSFSKTVKDVDIAIFYNAPPPFKKSYEVTFAQPVMMSFGIVSTCYNVNDVIHGMIRVESPNPSVNVFDVTEMKLVKKEIFVVDKNQAENVETVCSIDILQGVPEPQEPILFNMIIPTEKVPASFKTQEGFLLAYSVIISVKKDEKVLAENEMPLTLLKTNTNPRIESKRKYTLLEWIDEKTRFDKLEAIDVVEVGLINKGFDVFENVEEKDDDDTIRIAQEELDDDYKQTKTIEFE